MRVWASAQTMIGKGTAIPKVQNAFKKERHKYSTSKSSLVSGTIKRENHFLEPQSLILDAGTTIRCLLTGVRGSLPLSTASIFLIARLSNPMCLS